MIGIFHYAELFLSRAQDAAQRLPLWILAGFLTLGVLFALWKSLIFPITFHKKELRWFVIALILLLPCNYFAQAAPFKQALLTSTGIQIPARIFVLGLLPAFTALGFAGPAAALALAALSGLLQALFFGQDYYIILLYSALTAIFITLTRRTDLEGSGQSARQPLVNALLAFLFALPIGLLVSLTFVLVTKGAGLTRLPEQFLLLGVVLLVPALAAGAACQALQRWYGREWHPLDYMKEWEIRSPIKQTIAQIERLTLGRYDHGLKLQVRSASEAKLAQALEDLRENLRLRNDTQSRLLSLDPSHYSREGYDLVLSSILRAALGRDASTARLILLSSGAPGEQAEMRLRLGQGDQTRIYAYLDAMILDKLGSQEQLILSDLQVDQYFGLSSGMPYPQSIAALRLKNAEITQGILWVGFDQNYWFSQEDIRFYQQLAYRASAVLSAKEQYARLQNENTVLTAAIETLPEPVVVLDDADGIQLSNSAAKRLMETNGQNPASPITFQAAFPAAALAGSASGGIGGGFITQIGRLEFEVETLELDPGSGVRGKLLVFHETTPQKQLNAQKNEYVSFISHDLRSPLSHIRGYLNMLENIGNLSEEQTKYITRIRASIEQMSRLVSKVLSLDMLDSGEGIKFTSFDVKEVVEEVIALLELQASQRKVSIQTNFSGIKNPRVSADRLLLQQAVFNLIENAIKFSHVGGEVLVSAKRADNRLSIAVQDHGKGIAPLDQPKLFSRFFHVDETDNLESRSLGLGLAIVKSIAEKHGGIISVQSQLGEGSTFTLEIPIRND